MTQTPDECKSSLRRSRWLLGLTFLWPLIFLRSTLSNGDAATYLTQILNGDLSTRTIHFGYFLSSIPFLRLGAAAPVITLNLISILWGFLGIWALLGLERALVEAPRTGWSGLWWLANISILTTLTTAEVYSAQWAALIFALYMWVKQAPRLAGFIWFFAMLITPASLAALPAFFLRKAAPREWGWLVGIGLGGMALFCAFFAEDYFWGQRGLLIGPQGMSVLEAFSYRAPKLSSTLGLGLIPFGFGLLAALDGRWPQGRRLIAATLAQALCVWLFVDRYRDIEAHGLTLALMALVVAAGCGRIRGELERRFSERAAFSLLALPLVFQLFIADQAVRSLRRKDRAFADFCARVYRTLPEEAVVVGSFSQRRLFEWYTVGRTDTDLTMSTEKVGTTEDRPVVYLYPPEGDLGPKGAMWKRLPSGAWLLREKVDAE